jgi:rhodanese-related sulfurtransferase
MTQENQGRLTRKQKKLFTFGIILFAIAAISIWGHSRRNTLANSDSRTFEHISPKDAYTMSQEHKGNENFVILDVRTAKEIAKGYIEGAIRLDYYTKSFRDEVNKFDKQKIYLVYCHSGVRSSRTLHLMQQLNFKTAYNMQGGIVGWRSEDLPIVTPENTSE